jgi:hypothetical protein
MFRYQALLNMEQKPICRFCLDSDDEDSSDFVHPCKCKGTGGNVHLKCLNKWITQSGDTHCKVCRGKYETQGMTKPRRRVQIDLNENERSLSAKACSKLMVMIASVSIYVLIMSNAKEVDYVFMSLLMFIISFFILRMVHDLITNRMVAHMEDPDDDVTTDQDIESSGEQETTHPAP